MALAKVSSDASSLPVFLCFCVFHEAILSVFSREYTAAGMVLIILSLANLIDAGVGSTGDLLVMTGHTRVVLANTAVSITVNTGLSFLLVPRFNGIGAAIASALALVIPSVAGTVRFGVSVGGGISLPVGDRPHAFVEARYHDLLGMPSQPMWLVPVTFGIRY